MINGTNPYLYNVIVMLGLPIIVKSKLGRVCSVSYITLYNTLINNA